jgi:preprotein translocase subunit SecA
MFKWLANFGDSNEREIKKLDPIVKKINEFEPEFDKLSDAELKAKTAEFKKRIADATAELNNELARVKTDLAGAQKCQLEAVFDEKEDLSKQCKDLQSKSEILEKSLKKLENEVLDKILPEAFAAVREAAKRTIHQRHFDVQLIGAMVLHHGRIAEMRTGEGKTLVATLPLYLNSLTGRGAHLVTVNDYLARRDPYWMGPIFNALGVSVASIYPMQTPDEHMPARLYDPSYVSEKENDPWSHFKPIPRKEAYLADITYGTSAEFGFDYLRDNMAVDLSQCSQRELYFAIVDEADNLLIDEARTPLIISGQAEDSSRIYQEVDSVVSRMKWKLQPHEPATEDEKNADAEFEEQYDYIAYEKSRSVKATSLGQSKIARAFGYKTEDLFGGEQIGHGVDIYSEEEQKKQQRVAIFRQSMTANALYKKDVDYVLKNNEIIIVDEFTGRLMLGRRYSEGLHQAIEAKEHVKVQQESKTYATITIQNYFRMYSKLAGMTGTAETEAEELAKIYKLEVVVIPTNKALIREDLGDFIYKDEAAKFKALVREVEEVHKTGRPILIGTVSIQKNEELDDMLSRRGVKHNVLNAKKHEQEASIIARAGEEGAVMVATNMAGRGVDIILGGKPPENGDAKVMEEWQARHNKVVALGGLHVIGSERHEARRIDNQLRGRAGRQGDPGSSHFYVALDDDIMRKFGGERIQGIMNWAGMDENTPIENRLISRSIENAQMRVEGFHFDMRKHLVDYDDVINQQREVIYGERRKILSGADLRSNILHMVKQEIEEAAAEHFNTSPGEEADYAALFSHVSRIFPLPKDFTQETLSRMSKYDAADNLYRIAEALYAYKEKDVTPAGMRVLERLVMLKVIDSLWVEHLTGIDNLRQGIGMRAVAQQDPLVAYKHQASEMFQELMDTIREDVTHTIFKVNIIKQNAQRQEAPKPILSPMAKIVGTPGATNKPALKPEQKAGRNDPCPCGSGKKYKHCCGK